MKKLFKPLAAFTAVLLCSLTAYSQVEFKETVLDDDGLVKEIVVSGKRDYSIVLAKDYSYMAKTAENRLIPMEIENQSMVGRFTRRFDGITLVFPGENGLWGLKSVVNDSVLLEPKFRIILNHLKDHVLAYGVDERGNEFYEWTGDPLNPLNKMDMSTQSVPMTEFTISQEILKSGGYIGTTNYEIAIGSQMAPMRTKRMEDDSQKNYRRKLDIVDFKVTQKGSKKAMSVAGVEVLTATDYVDIVNRNKHGNDNYWFILAYDKKRDDEEWSVYSINTETGEFKKVTDKPYFEIQRVRSYEHILECRFHTEKKTNWSSENFRYDGKTGRLITQKWNGRNYVDAE